MPELSFQIESVEAPLTSVTPELVFKLRVTHVGAGQDGRSIAAIMLRCMIRIEPTKRRYGPETREPLRDLFGPPELWSKSVRAMPWTTVTLAVPSFTDSVIVDVPTPCTFDFDVAATKYFYALEDGIVPLTLLFSGTVFYKLKDERLQITQIPWDKEVDFRLPVEKWRGLMEHYYPDCAWLRLGREAFDRLLQYKTRQGIPTWNETIDSLCTARGDGDRMNRELVDRIARAVLYEGYILYPYRPSVKNHQRWTFGGLMPREYCAAHSSGDVATAGTECLLTGATVLTSAQLTVKVRFIHLTHRQVYRRDVAVNDGSIELFSTAALASTATCEAEIVAAGFQPVHALQIGSGQYHTWQEGLEREAEAGPYSLDDLMREPVRFPFAFDDSREIELLRDQQSVVAGALVRRRHEVRGELEILATPIAQNSPESPEAYKIVTRIANLTAQPDAATASRDDGLARSLNAAHLVLEATDAEFVSLLETPKPFVEAAGHCRQLGLWPVLVGEPNCRDTVLASPIILYDYPQIAAESPGDLFDGGEIDEILTLRILTLTDDEKRAMAAVDPRARALLERTESLDAATLGSLHGAIRDLRRIAPAGETEYATR